jgi:hypothetical protein
VPVPGPCGVIEAEINDLKSQITFLEAELARVPLRERAPIMAEIQELRAQLTQKQADLDACIKRELG